MTQLDQRLSAIKEELINIRKDFHRRPELGFQEYQTAAKAASYMENLGFEVTAGIGGTGVIGLLRGRNAGPTIALRACLDALAIEEQSGVLYSSENSGIMHACGHDGNMTMVLGAANILSQYQDRLNGNVKFIFQPSEENTGGAAEIIKAGGLKAPDVDVIITPHNWHGLKQGVLVVKPGPVLASSDIFQLKIIGTPGHGAWPYLAVDPIVVAADVISRLQSIISREIDPLKSAVITIGKVVGGTAVNIIPKVVTLEGTVRTLDPGVRDFIQTRIEEIAKCITQAARAAYELTYDRIMPPVNNDIQLTTQVYEILKDVFDPCLITNDFMPSMGCEEFALFQEKIPGLFLFIGNDREGCDTIPIHSPHYVFNDEILVIGVKALCKIVFGYCKMRK
jgi:amidohydrolase